MSNFVLEKYIDPDLCDNIILAMDEQDQQWTDSTRGYWLVSSDKMNSTLLHQYKQEIFKLVAEYKAIFNDAFTGMAAMELEEPFNFQNYSPGYNYSTWHCENNGQKPYEKRVLAFMTYLNTVEHGGETNFMYQNMKVTPKKGKTLVWPAYFTHTHMGLPAPTEKKCIVTGWVKFSPWVDVNLDESDEDFYKNLNTETQITW